MALLIYVVLPTLAFIAFLNAVESPESRNPESASDNSGQER